MKKGFLAGAALALAVAAPVTVFAEDEKTTSADAKDAKIVLQGPMDSNGAAVVGQSVATQLNEAWGLSLDAEYTIVWVGEAVVMENGEVVKNYGPGLKLDVNAADKGGELIIHLKSSDGKAEVGTSLTLKSEDLSPVAVVKKIPMGGDDGGTETGGNEGGKAGGTPNTGDSNNTGLWTGALIVSALLAGAAFVMNKRNA